MFGFNTPREKTTSTGIRYTVHRARKAYRRWGRHHNYENVTISLIAPSTTRLDIRQERPVDQIAKDLSIAVELQTGDANFDQAFYKTKDKSPAVTHYSIVTDKHTPRKGSPHLVYQSWRMQNGANIGFMNVPRNIWNEVEIGKTKIKCVTKQGALGFEWIVSQELQ